MIKLLALLLPLALLTGCSEGTPQPAQNTGPAAQVAQSGVVSIGPREAAALLQERRDMVLLDVRTPEELKEGAIERAILTPFWSLVRGTMSLPQDKPIMLVCAVGGRSYAAAQILIRNGHREVYNLRGGIVAWKHEGLPLKYYQTF
jgi:rhodanese-related sulfurtransferase